ncbi:MAG TPA: MaoC/PaaZ C-terminal domain-containing protein [Symbiobacteriaceae bacterium]|jgi:acyl dehydratase
MQIIGLEPGEATPSLEMAPVHKVQLVKYAGASGDFNLIHTDAETARAAGLGDVIAHGMLSMGFLGRYLTELAGPENVRRLGVKFQAMVRLGDVLTCRGIVKARTPLADGRTLLTLEIWAENQRGEKVTTGEGDVWVSPA